MQIIFIQNHPKIKYGKIYLTHTKLNGKYAIRFVVAQTNVSEEDVMESWELIREFIK
jgi:hypothetical protein